MNLVETFSNVKEWLIFAEAKNAALLALLGVMGVPIVPLTSSSNVLFACYAVSASILCAISAFIALISFIPKLNVRFGSISRNSNEATNLIFFESIAALSKEEYIKTAMQIYEVDGNSKLALHVLDQIHNLSKIASRKMFLFKWALWFAIAGIFTPLAVLVLLILAKNEREASEA